MAGRVCAFWHPNHIKRHHERAADAQIASLKQQAEAQKQETSQLKASLLEQINATHNPHQQEIHDGYQVAHNAALDELAIAKQINDELLASLSFFWIYGKALIKAEYEAQSEAIHKAKETELQNVSKDGFFTRLFSASSRFEQDLQQVDAKFKQSFDNLEIEKAELLAAFEENYRGAVHEQKLKFVAFIDRHEAMLQELEVDKALKLDELNVFFDSQKQLLEEQYVADLGAIDAAAQKVIGNVNSSLAQHFKELDSNRRSFAINGLLIIGSSLIAFAAPQFLVATIGKAAMITLQVSAGTTAVGAANNLFNDTGTYAINANLGLDPYNHKPYSPPVYQSTPNWRDEVYFPDSGQRVELNPFNNNRISNYPNVSKPHIYSNGPSSYSSEYANNSSQPNKSYAPSENRIPYASAQPTMPKQIAQQPLTPPKSGMLNWSRMAWRSLTNDKSPEVLNWQKNNRNSFPTAAAFFDSINNSKSQKAVNAFSDALVNRAAMPIMFAAEEVSRIQQQQQTKTEKFIHKAANVIQDCKDFVENDTEHFLAQETTQTQIFFESVGNFIAADYQRLREGQATITGTAITQIGTAVTEDFKALSNMSSTEIAAQLGHEAGDTLLFFMAGGALHKGRRAVTNAVDTVKVVGSEFIAANKSPLIFRTQHEAMPSASPFNANRLQQPIVRKNSEIKPNGAMQTHSYEGAKLHDTKAEKRVEESAHKAWNKLLGNLKQSSLTPAFDQIKSFSVKAELDGAFYPKEKLPMLVRYLEKRGVNVYATDRSPCFRGTRNGPCQIYLPENPTILQVKHELSHWLDFKQLGFDDYAKLSTYERENLVLERLQGNRLWESLNQFEKEFSINYVNKIKEGYKPGAYYD